MSTPLYIAREWQFRAATSVGYEIDGRFRQIAECSGFGRSSEDAERAAAQIAAALNAQTAAVETMREDPWTALDTHYASEVAGIRALPRPVTWTELHRFGEEVARIVHARNAPVMQAPSRESQMVVLQRNAEGTPTVWCDPEIAPIVQALNAAGLRTVASCSGHGERPANIALADGREVFIARSHAEARAVERPPEVAAHEPNSAIVTALLRELQAADRIISNALQIMTQEQKSEWARMNDAADLIESGTTRHHERAAVIAQVLGKQS